MFKVIIMIKHLVFAILSHFATIQSLLCGCLCNIFRFNMVSVNSFVQFNGYKSTLLQFNSLSLSIYVFQYNKILSFMLRGSFRVFFFCKEKFNQFYVCDTKFSFVAFSYHIQTICFYFVRKMLLFKNAMLKFCQKIKFQLYNITASGSMFGLFMSLIPSKMIFES